MKRCTEFFSRKGAKAQRRKEDPKDFEALRVFFAPLREKLFD
jgi:hypothetical protein